MENLSGLLQAFRATQIGNGPKEEKNSRNGE